MLNWLRLKKVEEYKHSGAQCILEAQSPSEEMENMMQKCFQK